MSKVGRNDPCPCGNGKKYKKCCLEGDLEKARSPSMGGMDVQILGPEEWDAMDEWEALDDRFQAADFGEKVRMLSELCGAPPEDEDMLLEWFLDLNDAAVSQQDRHAFGNCVDLLKASLPDTYAEITGVLLNERLMNAVKDCESDAVGRLFCELARFAHRVVDEFFQRTDQLAYLGYQDALVEGFRVGWPLIQAAGDDFDSAITDFAQLGADSEIYTYLESTQNPDPENPDLADRIRNFLGNEETQLEVRVGDIIGLADGSWERKDYEITRNVFRKNEDERSRFYQRLHSLVSTFLGWLHREKGMSYARAGLVRMDLILFLVERLDGDLRNIGFLNRAPYKNNLSIQILVPDRENLDDYLNESFSSFNLMFHRGMAFLEGVPYWLEFLKQRRILDEDSHHMIFKSLSLLFQEIEGLWEENGKENDIEILALKRAWTFEKPTRTRKGESHDPEKRCDETSGHPGRPDH